MTTQKKIGSYQIIKRIAEGGMAEVYLGMTESRFGVSKLVAIKTTLPNLPNIELYKEMFFKEIRVSANLNHQNIGKIYDFGMHEDRAYMVMEYIHGVTLRDLMAYHRDKEEPLSTAFILYIIHQVSVALAYAYQSVDPQTGTPLKLIHRDISPHNILVSFEGEVKIIDFGIAKASIEAEETQLGQVKGKVAYMSPEQINREELDNRTDIFSLGIVFWELLANARFFGGSNVGEVKDSIRLYDVMNLPTAIIKDRSEDLLSVLPRMLHQDPNQRASDANELARQIGTLLSSKHPDFSALALADYLKEVFAVTYKDTMEEIRNFVLEDEETMTISETASAEEIMSILTHNSISDPSLLLRGGPLPPPPPEYTPPPPFFSTPRLRTAPIKNIPNRPLHESGKISNILWGGLAIAAVLTIGLLMGQNTLDSQRVQAEAKVEVPQLTPLPPRRVVAQPQIPAPPSPFKKPPTYSQNYRKNHKARTPSSTKAAAAKKKPLKNQKSHNR
ncbi:serine/threonine-protein kinase [Bdellovibrio sp. HCB209]|uniref:serine/threonine-protein kinase n=1 Tax=Bdellovibrio sp. HCB209 TaxID=3394354 RepID=UPI0039B65380